MKIAMIGQKRIPAGEGGIEKSVEEISARLVERGHEVTVYNRAGHNIFGRQYDSQEHDVWRGVRIRTVRAPQGRAQVPVYAWRAMRMALASDADVIMLHASGSSLRAGMARRRGRPVVCMLHGIDSRRDKWGPFAAWYLRRGEKAAVTQADACIVLSRNMQREMEALYGRPTILGSNGVDRPARTESTELLDRLGLEPDGYVLWTGRFVPEKGLQQLIPAFRACRTDKKLVLAGGREERYPAFAEEMKALAEDDPRIVFPGFVPPSRIGELYQNAYLFTLPSHLEGMSHSMLEAMSHGCCCLFSDIAENAEAAQEHAVYFRAGDEADLKEKLQMLLDDPQLAASYREPAADHITSVYSWDRSVDGILEVLEQAVRKHAKAGR